MKNMKRIAAITIKRMVDECPDTSYLGEYSNDAETDYAIDRKHSTDCQINNLNQGAQDVINHAMDHLTAHTYGQMSESEIQDATDAQDLLIEKQDELQECDCGGRGDMERNQYRYFNGNVENYKGESPEDIRKYILQDYELMERLQRGDWCYIGIRAEAEVSIPSGDASILQEITSGGLWGVESDSDKDYIASIEGEELGELRKQLYALGFSKRAIATACKNVTHKDA
jgi:hypothetical protein